MHPPFIGLDRDLIEESSDVLKIAKLDAVHTDSIELGQQLLYSCDRHMDIIGCARQRCESVSVVHLKMERHRPGSGFAP